MISRDVYIETVKRHLAKWDGEIDHLDARADIILLQLEDRYYTLLRALRGKEMEIKSGLQQLKAADETCWRQLLPVLAGAASELELALTTAEQELAATRVPLGHTRGQLPPDQTPTREEHNHEQADLSST